MDYFATHLLISCLGIGTDFEDFIRTDRMKVRAPPAFWPGGRSIPNVGINLEKPLRMLINCFTAVPIITLKPLTSSILDVETR